MPKSFENNIKKIYCVHCDMIFNSRKSFQKHLLSHSSTILSEACPIDTVLSKFVDLFRRKSTRNLE